MSAAQDCRTRRESLQAAVELALAAARQAVEAARGEEARARVIAPQAVREAPRQAKPKVSKKVGEEKLDLILRRLDATERRLRRPG